MDSSRLTPALVIGAVLAIGGIGLFLLLWNAFSGMGEIQRITLSLCIPPALMVILIGGYYLVRGGQKTSS
jgi:hypothetical protein